MKYHGQVCQFSEESGCECFSSLHQWNAWLCKALKPWKTSRICIGSDLFPIPFNQIYLYFCNKRMRDVEEPIESNIMISPMISVRRLWSNWIICLSTSLREKYAHTIRPSKWREPWRIPYQSFPHISMCIFCDRSSRDNCSSCKLNVAVSIIECYETEWIDVIVWLFHAVSLPWLCNRWCSLCNSFQTYLFLTNIVAPWEYCRTLRRTKYVTREAW